MPAVRSRALLVWSAGDETEALQGLVPDPKVLVRRLDESGDLGPDLPRCDQTVIVADWARLARAPSTVDRWRRTLAPCPMAVIVLVERERLDEALLRTSSHEVDDFLERPYHPGHLARKVGATFRHLAVQQITGLQVEATGHADSDLRVFQRVALALSAEADISRLLELIITKCREVTSADGGSLYLVEPNASDPASPSADAGRLLRFVVAQSDSKVLDLASKALPIDSTSVAGYVALTRTPISLPDAHQLPPNAGFTFNPTIDERLGYRSVSMLAIPMVDHANELVGVVEIINKKRSRLIRLDTPEAAAAEALPFEPRDQEMVSSLASLAAVVVTRRRQAEAERRELEVQLRQAQKMEAVGRLAGGVAHDFNNLLTVIAGRTHLLLHRVEATDPRRRHIDLIRHTCERASALTQQLLAFSRKQVLQPKVVDLNAIVSGAEPILRRLIGEDVELTIVTEPRLGRTKADPGQLEQVIMNLVVNARDAMPGGGRLTIETLNAELDEAFAHSHPGARAGEYVMLAARDTGVGMSPEVQAHLFEPFFTTKEPGKGTGLGLAMVYGIVKQHRGYVGVESQVGRGTTFAVYLPRVEEQGHAHEVAAAPARTPAGSETILLVEDEEAVRALVREILEMEGYSVLEARSGGEALLISERQRSPIHLLLTDVVMPQMNGRELADRLLAVHPRLKVLYMSGYTPDAIVHHGVLDPGTAFLRKPCTPDALARKVREVLDRD